MSETIEEPKEEKKWTGKRRKLGFKNKMAMLEIIERKRITDRIDFKAISHRHGISAEALRQLWYQWKRGRIDLGEPASPEEKAIDIRMQHETTLVLIRRYKALVLNVFESSILNAEDDLTNGIKDSWKLVSPVLSELKKVTDIQVNHEKGYLSVLEDMMATRERGEKSLGDKPTDPVVETRIVHANEEERALAVLLASAHARQESAAQENG